MISRHQMLKNRQLLVALLGPISIAKLKKQRGMLLSNNELIQEDREDMNGLIRLLDQILDVLECEQSQEINNAKEKW